MQTEVASLGLATGAAAATAVEEQQQVETSYPVLHRLITARQS